MLAQGRRGRACQPCRRRKIKCGEQTPACRQCITAKIECPGPVTGPMIVEVLPQRGRRPYRQGDSGHPGNKKDALTKEAASPVGHSGEGSMSGPGSARLDAVSDSLVVFDAMASKFMETVYVPHQRHDSVVSHILDFVAGNHLPKLRRSIGAVSLAMGGIATGSWVLLQEGQQLYGDTLKALISEMLRENGQGSVASQTIRQVQPRPISIETIALSVVCVWYEAISSTTNGNAWIEHSWGAGRLVLTRPPEDYIAGLAHAVFRTVRYMVANASLTTTQPTPLALDHWLNAPFSSCSKGPFDRIVDFMLVIPVCLSRVQQLCAACAPIPESLEVENLRRHVLQLDEQLEIWWLEYQERFTRSGQRIYVDINHDFEDASGTYHPATRRFQSDDAYESIAHYGICRLVVALMGANLSSRSEQRSFRSQALSYSALTLSATAFADAQSTTGKIREYFGMSIPHVVIFCATPSRSHRAYAKRRIENWADPRGFRGVCGTEETVMKLWRAMTAVWDDTQ